MVVSDITIDIPHGAGSFLEGLLIQTVVRKSSIKPHTPTRLLDHAHLTADSGGEIEIFKLTHLLMNFSPRAFLMNYFITRKYYFAARHVLDLPLSDKQA